MELRLPSEDGLEGSCIRVVNTRRRKIERDDLLILSSPLSPDFSRYARRSGDQIMGQIFIIPVCLIMGSFVGVVITSCAGKTRLRFSFFRDAATSSSSDFNFSSPLFLYQLDSTPTKVFFGNPPFLLSIPYLPYLSPRLLITFPFPFLSASGDLTSSWRSSRRRKTPRELEQLCSSSPSLSSSVSFAST